MKNSGQIGKQILYLRASMESRLKNQSDNRLRPKNL